jgi:hypothetical protein
MKNGVTRVVPFFSISHLTLSKLNRSIELLNGAHFEGIILGKAPAFISGL